MGAAPVTLASLFDAAPERERKARHFNSQALQLPKAALFFITKSSLLLSIILYTPFIQNAHNTQLYLTLIPSH